jgi:hypothetical protein
MKKLFLKIRCRVFGHKYGKRYNPVIVDRGARMAFDGYYCQFCGDWKEKINAQ